MSKKHIPVEGYRELVRDASSQAIINVDNDARRDAKAKRALAKRQKLEQARKDQEINTLKRDVSDLKKDLSGVKELLGKILEKL